MHAGRVLVKTTIEGPSSPPVPLAVVRIECGRCPEATAEDGRVARPAGLHLRIRRAVSTKGAIMSPEKFAIVVAMVLFASGAIGFVLERLSLRDIRPMPRVT